MASSYIAELNVCAWVIWPPLVLQLALVAGKSSPSPPRWTVAGLIGLLWVVSFLHLWTWTFGDEGPLQLRALCREGKLAGIVTTETRARELGTLDAFVRSHTRRGDFVLAYGGFWGLSWLSDTRPALYATIVAPEMPREPVLSQWLQSSTIEGRQPKLVTTAIPLLGKNALEEAILKGFVPMLRVGRIEVWLPKQATLANRSSDATSASRLPWTP